MTKHTDTRTQTDRSLTASENEAAPACMFCKRVPPPPQVCTDDMTAAICFECIEKFSYRRDRPGVVNGLIDAIRWALGEHGEFGEEPEPLAGKYRRRFWWRTELRARMEAALQAQSPAAGRCTPSESQPVDPSAGTLEPRAPSLEPPSLPAPEGAQP